MLLHKKLQYILLVLTMSSVMLSISCKKVQEVEYVQTTEDKIVVQTRHMEQLSKTGVTLFGSIDTIQNQKILSYGFIVKTIDQSGTERKEKEIEAGKENTGPTITFQYKPTEPFSLDITYAYSFYVRTAKGYYRGEFNSFKLDGFKSQTQAFEKSKSGDELVVKGDFEKIDANYKFKAYFQNPNTKSIESNEIPYMLAADKKTIRFKVPHATGLYHGAEIGFLFERKEFPYGSFYADVAKTTILGEVLPPTKTVFSPYDIIEIKGINVPHHLHESKDFMLIFGDMRIPFASELQFNQIQDLRVKGNRLKFGYTNGVETVIFKEEIEFYVPDLLKVMIDQPFVHPESLVSMRWPGLSDFNAGMYFDFTVGGLPVKHNGVNGDNFDFTIGDLKPGNYTLNIKDSFYDITIPNQITVKNFDWISSDKSSAYEGESITVYGTFFKGAMYAIQGKNNLSSEIMCQKDGEITFAWYLNNFETNKIKVGYITGSRESRLSDKILEINSLGITLDSFAPASGLTGSVVHVKGKNIKYARRILIGDIQITPIPISNDEIMFTVPMMASKGKVKISAEAANKIYQSSGYFETL
ncbi:IPT/TIG domain-containing protein [Sphingobacterium faecium]|uniref:IPT/TIG domain-containing protein n=1 Tax=Sphingobacterium faecium TaxID=34087 RepID=UPI000D337B97|nr:IPT/TIG domain-containing protein [Sphingobacterium faecium]PTX14097.1 hypothetical protein C8N37_101856 [Sphingobacterium faecium]